MGTQADYSHEVAQIIDDEVRKLIEAAHTEAWEILTEYRDVLDILAGELLEKETLHRAELQAIFEDVKKRPRLTMFDDFGGRVPSDKPPIKTPGELAIERGEPWPRPVPEPAFKTAIAQASRAAEATKLADSHKNGTNGNGANGNVGPTQPDYGAPAGWHAPGWPPPQQPNQPQPNQQQPQGYWYPPPPPNPGGWHNPNAGGPAPGSHVAGGPYPPYQSYPQPGHPPQGGQPSPDDGSGQENGRHNPHG
jgi:cell division protease FtsH